MQIQQLEQVSRMVRDHDFEGLRALRLSRYSIRTFVVPLVRGQLGEIPPARVRGLSSNWAGKPYMSRYA